MPDYVNQAKDYKCRMRNTTNFNRMFLECQGVIQEAFLKGNFNINSHLWYFCSIPVMAVVLKNQKNLSFCFRQENQYPIPFDCMPVNILPHDIDCSKIFEYHKALYASTTSQPSLSTSTFVPTIASPLKISTEKIKDEEKGNELLIWKYLALTMAILMILAVALCILLFPRTPKTTAGISLNTRNPYDSTPMIKQNDPVKITGTSLVTEV
uniref:Uncharacterized protein n=1 Tax=Panagrolaimus sp. ES5 TaxID=591445 RepID=A0AC34G3Y3_9BILA